jgi:hypothetical protein
MSNAPKAASPASEPNPPYRVKQLAKKWGVDESVVRRAFRRGELSGFQLGRLILIHPESADRYGGPKAG